MLLSDDFVLGQCQSRHHSEDSSVLTDIVDGTVFKKNSLFQSCERSLSIILYEDSFEIVNPLGSARIKHKILAMYFTLGNTQPEYRSVVDAMQLVFFCKEVDFKVFGQQKVFERVINDLKTLEEVGIETSDGVVWKGALSCILGDNLGSHCIGGFIESFSGTNMCRYCLITSHDFKCNAPYAVGKPRTKEEYDSCIAHLEDHEENHHQGIKFNSCFNSLRYFHVCAPGLPPCLGHDLFEGVVDYDVAMFIQYWIKQKHWFTYADLNIMLVQFKFQGRDANNKPAFVNLSGNRLGGQAVENWNLLRLLPIILSAYVKDHNDLVWRLFLLLREVVEYVCSPKISHEQLAYLRVIMEEYLTERKQLFADTPFRPKHHFLSHYPDLIIKFGPLMRVWTLCFESKHSYFKRCARSAQNFINVTQSLANQHQYFQAYNSSGKIYPDRLVIENATSLNIECFMPEIKHALQAANVKFDDSVISDRVQMFGTSYQKGFFVICQCSDTCFSSLKLGCILFVVVESQKELCLSASSIMEQLGVYNGPYKETYSKQMWHMNYSELRRN